MPADHQGPIQQLDVRPLREPAARAAVFATYNALAVGDSFVLIDDHDPEPLREEFDVNQAGSYDWEYLDGGAHDWRIRITKRATTPLPRILTYTGQFTTGTVGDGPLWTLQVTERDLDSNIIALPPGGAIEAHAGPDVDVLIHVLAGHGHLTTERGTIELRPGALVWLPRRSQRHFAAGPDGLRYLTVHQRRQALVLDTSRAKTGR